MSDMSSVAANTDWLTKAQVAQILGVAEKTVDRLAVKGKLQKQTRERPGLPPVVVFHPGDVERERVARNQPTEAFVVPDGVNSAVGQQLVSRVPDMSELYGLMGGVIGHATAEMMVRQDFPVFLTTQQAAEYSGLSEDFLLKLVRAGTLRRVAGMRGFRYKKTDLDKLELS
jgi:excisionase family DNA binding protein